MIGTARIDGRPVVVGGDDFTIRGGAYSPAGLRKGIYADELAIRRRVPLVRLLEGGGASIAGATGVRGRSGYDWTASSPLNLALHGGARHRAGRRAPRSARWRASRPRGSSRRTSR